MEDTLHAVASIPSQPDRRARTDYLWGRPAVTPKFTADTELHEMQICHDDGLYRHLKFCRPDTNNCSFQIFTTPGSLAIAGDMGTYVFARLEDMFVFFETPSGKINPDYWSQKVTAQDVHCPVRSFSREKFRQVVWEDFNDRKYAFDPAQQQVLRNQIEQQIIQNLDTSYEDAARQILEGFHYWYQPSHGPRIEFDYEDAGTWDFSDYSYHFLWCLEAIVFGIARYKNA